eukprot:evm.model.scf_11.7 EVM.evm.TU.scf_11.7   scf_11:47578-52580(+)
MPTDDITPLSVETVNRMISFALNSARLKEKLMDTTHLITEINIQYARAMNGIIFDRRISQGAVEGCSVLSPDRPDDCASPAEDINPPPQNVGGTVPMPPYDFLEQFSEFSFTTLLTKGEVIAATVKMRAECHKVLKMSLFNTHFSKATKPDEFDQSQVQAGEQVSNYLKDTWSTGVRNAIRNSFKDIGKGWFHLQETNRETYEFSKLRRFNTLTRFVMEDTLRYLLEGLRKFREFLKSCTAYKVAVNGSNDVEVCYYDGDSVTLRRYPLFLVELVVTKEEQFAYSSDPEEIPGKMVSVVDHAISCVQGIPQLEPSIMDKMFWAHIPLLNTPHPMEPHIVGIRDEIRGMWEAPVRIAQDYLRHFEHFLPFVSLDIDAYVEDLKTRGLELSLEELTAEIDTGMRNLEALQSGMPVTMNLGWLSVNFSKVRDQLVGKLESLVSKLKALLSAIPMNLMESVSAQYVEIEKALAVSRETIEDVDRQRMYIANLPNKIKDIAAEIEGAQPWYDALKSYHFLLPNDVAKKKLKAESWHLDVSRLAEEAEQAMVDEENKYQTEMLAEQEGFAESLNDISNMVAKFEGFVDLGNLDYVVKEAKLIQEKLKQADKDSEVFNAREAIFGLPTTDYSRIKKISDTFDPFLQFWSCASTWKV